MPFELSKLKNYRKPESYSPDDLIDIKLPAELAAEKVKGHEFLIFIVDDDPYLLQAINTQLFDIELFEKSNPLKIIVQNYATGKSVLKDMHLRPDLIILNPVVNNGIKNTLSGRDIVNKVMDLNRYQPLLVLGELYDHHDSVVSNPYLRKQILGAVGAKRELMEILHSLVSS